LQARATGQSAPGRIEPRDAVLAVHHQQASANVHRRRFQHAPALDHRELGGPAADIDIEDPQILVVRDFGGARAIGRQHRLHMVPGRGADELAPHFREELGDGLRVFPAQCLPGQDHRPGVDLVRVQARRLVCVIDDPAERLLVDPYVVDVRRERHGRLVQRVAGDHEIPARQVFARAAHVKPREDHLRAGRADVDADADERKVVVEPERIFLERTGRSEVVIVVVIGAPVAVDVIVVAPVQVIGKRMPPLFFAVVHHAA